MLFQQLNGCLDVILDSRFTYPRGKIACTIKPILYEKEIMYRVAMRHGNSTCGFDTGYFTAMAIFKQSDDGYRIIHCTGYRPNRFWKWLENAISNIILVNT